jgi:hypothetical protein
MTPDNGHRTPLLDLDVLTEPMTGVKLDGVSYSIRAWEAFTLRERNRLAKISQRTAAIETLEEPTDDDSVEHDALAREAFGIIATPKLADGASIEKVRTAVATFFGLRLSSQSELLRQIVSDVAPAILAKTPKAGPSIGANGSRGSKRATRKRARKAG